MHTESPRRRTLRALLAPLAASLLLAGVPGLAHAEPSKPAAPETAPEASGDIEVEAAGPLLDEPQRGKAALRGLGDQVRVAALRNSMRPAELRSVLRSDRSAWLDGDGRLLYVEPPAGEVLASPPLAAPVAPLADTFALHSNPGANLTIFLDFDGAEVTNSAWNIQYGVAPRFHQGWDPAGDGPDFNADERLKVQQVWAIVAEDYAPFEVDVTTEDPGADRLTRTSSVDSVYGTRVLVTDSSDPYTKVCPGGCGGVAYVDVFDQMGTVYQPAWVFPQALGNDAKMVAEAAAHEAGHNLGLNHDGTSALDYYEGHGDWAPIMGVGYYRSISQWSRGSYLGANNTEDDLRVLTGYLGARQDEASGSVHLPSALPDGSALLGTPNDVDAYLLGSCVAGTTVSIAPVAFAPNLDIQATLYDSAGAARAVSDPASGRGDGVTASGMAAQLTIPADGTGWVVEVMGVGKGSWLTGGYDDYGSLGTYTIDASSCDGQVATGAPSGPRDLSSGGAGTTSTLSINWSAPADEGDSPVTGYRVSRSAQAEPVNLPADARGFTFTGLEAATTYQLTVQAMNAIGSGPTATVNATTEAPAPSVPSAPRDLVGSYQQREQKIQAWWTAPESSGTEPITGYAVFLDGAYLGLLGPASYGADITRVGGFAEGDYLVEIAAVNAVGFSQTAAVTVNVTHPRPPANDNIADAQLITGINNNAAGDNSYATSEATDPQNWAGGGGYSVWYSWTPEVDGRATFLTYGGVTNRDTTLAAYTGTPGTLVQVAGNDDTIAYHALVSFQATAGTRYLIAVDGFSFSTGNGPFTMAWVLDEAQTPAAPTGVSARSEDAGAFVSWDPATSIGTPLTHYTVNASAEGEPERNVDVPAGSTTSELTGLTNGTTYTVTVSATNAKGTSPKSEAVTVVPDLRDVSPPTASQFSSTRRQIDPFFHSGSTTLRVRLTDDRGIAGSPTISVAPQSGDLWYQRNRGWIDHESAQLTLISGDRRDGIWSANLSLDLGAPKDGWSAWVGAVDAAGNAAVGTSTGAIFRVVTDLNLGTVPAAPTNIEATAGTGRARVSWKPPSEPATDYTVWAHPGVHQVSVPGGRTSAVIDGLDNGTDYTFTVVAANAVGESVASPPSASIRPSATPSAPRQVTAVAHDGAATVEWVPNFVAEDVTSYRVVGDASGGDDVTLTAPSDAVSVRVPDLINGTAYSFYVIAVGAGGEGPASQPSAPVMPVGAPSRPEAPSVSAVGDSILVTWDEPATNGSAVTGYTVTGSNGAGVKTVAGDMLSVEFAGLARGTSYSFRVVASNAVGDSDPSPVSDSVAVAALVPDAPAKPTVRLQGQNATVSWVAPAANGSPVTGYTVTGSNGAGVQTVAGGVTSVEFPGLTRGASYSFTVVASNAVGDSEVSPTSDAVQVAALAPAKPTKPSAKVKGKKVVVTWVAPATNGAPITGYLIDLKKGKDRQVKAGARKLTVKKLKPGKHKIRVIALSAAGPSAASGWVTVKIKKKR